MTSRTASSTAAAGEAPQSEGASLVPCDVRRILVVDDDDAIRMLFEMILTEDMADVGVDTAHHGAEALKLFTSAHHAVVLMDLHMPVMDGRVAFESIVAACCARGWEMPAVVFCTGFAPPDPVLQAVQEDPKHVLLAKPVSGDQLLAAVRNAMAQVGGPRPSD